jgi:hypothetical protein
MPGSIRGREPLFLRPSPEELGLCGVVLGQTAALVEDEPVERAQGENLGVPVMKGDAIGLWELGGWEAFHASSMSCQDSRRVTGMVVT